MKHVLKLFGVDRIVCLDFETYWDKDYTLKKLATTEYIIDPRFKAHMVAVQLDTWAKPRVMSIPQFKAWARTIYWPRTALLGHHNHFDGFIASHHFGIRAKAYLCTLSMARPLMPITVAKNLDALSRALGGGGKQGGEVLVNTKGIRDLSKAEFRQMQSYAGNDADQTWFVFRKLQPYLPDNELRLIDMTVRMYTHPIVRINQAAAEQIAINEVASKQAKVDALDTTAKELGQNEAFAQRLRALGVDPPTKFSPTVLKKLKAGEAVPTEKMQPVYAFSKQDLEFKRLLAHPDPAVRQLVEARFAVKSTSMEAKSTRMSARASVLTSQPIYINYWGARTGRWSGADKSNWQNMTRGSDLRKTIEAPPGHVFIIADLAQIEARVNAWCAGQLNIVEAFRLMKDVYAIAASMIYGRTIDKEKDPLERFVGKVAVLALGYQAGAQRFAEMLRIGAFGPPVDITDSQARDVVAAWRQANAYIVQSWKRANNNAKSAFVGQQSITDGVITYEGQNGRGLTHLPNGTYIRYDGIQFDEEGMSYISEFRAGYNGSAPKVTRTRLYGGIIVENNIQALARCVIADQMLEVERVVKNSRIAMSTHDEIVAVVKASQAERALKTVKGIMSTAPSWAPGLPIAVDAHISRIYDK